MSRTGNNMPSRRIIMAGVAATAMLPARAVAQAPAGKSMLLMVDDPACIYCRRWMRDVAPGYQASPEGRALPLMRRQRGHGDLSSFARAIYTPTFIVVVSGREVGRIVGYQGPDFFWAEFGRIVSSAGVPL